ncbi:DNA-binding protein YbaB [Saccharomonospora amisosensis]|uniref:DNA-binding protein YbaB n=1 Tax=Saccharomonospora amisosensis TaxID=1128677 RepID=A0A7X5ZPC1_9PSEU|nr:YbaB/EbfC family nucleoid-associated protein [Saccharomonospora amisosensis]NIJ10075.1 DNA-binding protein YbaB [Saccharomonospora amisosensis]
MTSPEHVAQLKARLAKIKQNPTEALFSEYKGTSRTGAVTVWVDLLGRHRRLHIAPGTVRDGDEQWLTEEINSAYEAASRAATFLDFDVAEFAQELRDVAALRQQTAAPSETPQAPGTSGDVARRGRSQAEGRRGQGDDEFFDDFRIGR